MSPLTGEPQYGMSSNGDMSQYGMHGLPYMSGPQNGQSSSVDSTFGGDQSMGAPGFPVLPPYIPPGAPGFLSIEEINQRYYNARDSSVANNPCKLMFACLSHAHTQSHSTQHTALFTSSRLRPEGKQDRKQQLDTNPPTPLVRCAKAGQMPAPDIGRADGTCMLQSFLLHPLRSLVANLI